MYVDGYNFYYAIKHYQDRTPLYLGWCDFRRLAEHYMVPPGGKLVAVKYFTAPVGPFGKPGGEGGSENKRQAIWLRAVRTIDSVDVIQGVHTGNHSGDSSSRSRTRKEKETDVNIAVSMVVDAAKDQVDRLLLVTHDRDQLPAVRAVSEIFGKTIDVWLPPNQDMVHWGRTPSRDRVGIERITRDMLANSRLPESLQDASGTFQAPRLWRRPGG
jgi:uncharacterized LabA/DUF88 family protein